MPLYEWDHRFNFKIFRYSIGIALLCFFPNFSYAKKNSSTYGVYEVQSGDTLSEILKRFHLSPLYGNNGSIQKFTKLNSTTVKKNGDLIFPGSKILLPMSSESLAKQSNSESPAIADDEHERNPATASTALPAVVDPPPVATPVSCSEPQVTESHPTPIFRPNSEIEVAAEAGFSALYGVDRDNGTTARLLSNLNLGGRIAWTQNWDELDSSHIFLNYLDSRVESATDQVLLVNSGNGLSDFGAGYRRALSPAWSFSFDFEYADTLFYHGNTGLGGGLEINSLPILRLHPQLEYLVIERKPLSLSLQVGASYFGPTSFDNYTVDTGSGYDFSVILRHRFPSSWIQCQAFYQERQQNTSLIYLTEKNLGSICGYTWGFQ